MIDTNVSLSRWPFRRLPLDETDRLLDTLRDHGVTEAWAGSLDGLFHQDIGAVNERLAEDCRNSGDGILLPFGTVNPILPDWQEELRRCHEHYRMPGIRLHPGYQGYDLTHPDLQKLLKMAAERRMIVQLTISMEDERTQHVLHRVPSVNTDPLPELLADLPQLRLVLLNFQRSVTLNRAAELRNAGKVWFDIAMQEGIEGVARLAEQVSADRIVFGSHSPLFYYDSAVMKLTESGLPETVLENIRTGNVADISRTH